MSLIFKKNEERATEIDLRRLEAAHGGYIEYQDGDPDDNGTVAPDPRLGRLGAQYDY